MAYEHLKVDRRGALLDVTLNRPKKLNALNLEMVRELQSAFDAAEASQGCVALALRGEGERAFCAGGDIVAVRDASNHQFATRLSIIFIVGKDEDLQVSLPKGKGVKLSILEERKKRFKDKY